MNLLGYSFHPCKFEQSKDTPGDSTKLCYTSLKFYGQKPRPLKIPIPVDNPPESPVFLFDTWNLYMLFLSTPGKIPIFPL